MYKKNSWLKSPATEKQKKPSKKKVQIAQDKVYYLGFELQKGKRSLSKERVQIICSLTPPKTEKGLQTFLGITGYCRLWIPGYAEIAQPLYNAIKASKQGTVQWGEKQNQAFTQLKNMLTHGPALGLPNMRVLEETLKILKYVTVTNWEDTFITSNAEVMVAGVSWGLHLYNVWAQPLTSLDLNCNLFENLKEHWIGENC